MWNNIACFEISFAEVCADILGVSDGSIKADVTFSTTVDNSVNGGLDQPWEPKNDDANPFILVKFNSGSYLRRIEVKGGVNKDGEDSFAPLIGVSTLSYLGSWTPTEVS